MTASERQVAVLRRESGETTILTTGTHGRYLPDGHLIFSRDNSLWIAPFDAEELALTGEPVPLMDGVEHTADQGVHLDVAADGSMAYLPAGDYDAAVRRIAWIDRSGRQAPVGLEARPYVGAAISPDGSRIALAIREQGDTDIWIATPSRQTTTQLTAEPTNETLPVWTPDGKSIVFQSDRAGTDIYKRDAQGTGQADRLTLQQSSALQGPHSMTPDGARPVRTAVGDSRGHAAIARRADARQRHRGDAGSARVVRWTIPRVPVERVRAVRDLRERLPAEGDETMARVHRRRHAAAVGARQP